MPQEAKTDKRARADRRLRRLAEELRANLAKRKAQERARAATAELPAQPSCASVEKA